MNNSELVVNCDMIEFVEAKRETMISLITEKNIINSAEIDEIINRVAEFKSKAGNPVYKPKSPHN